MAHCLNFSSSTSHLSSLLPSPNPVAAAFSKPNGKLLTSHFLPHLTTLIRLCLRSTNYSARRLAVTALSADASGKKPLHEVKDLKAVIAETGQEILKGVNLVVIEGEVHAIMGKNVSGKKHILKGSCWPHYEVTGGSVIFKGENLLDIEPKDRSLAELFMSIQSPVEIPGVSNIDFLNMAYNARRGKLGLPKLGPIEVLEADFSVLDEIDSGVDVDALQDVAKAVNGPLTHKKSVLMVAHYRRLLEYIQPSFVHEDGRIIKTGNINIASVLEKEGCKAMSTS